MPSAAPMRDHHPVEQMTQGGEAQFRGRGSARLLQLLDIGGNMDALDDRKLPRAARLKPVEEFDGRARIGAARMRIANVGGEEFKEAIGRARAGGCNEGRGAVDDGDELVQGFTTLFKSIVYPAALSSLAKAIFHPSFTSKATHPTPKMSEGISTSSFFRAQTRERLSLPMK
jgi:hypothetical protein